DTFLNYMDNTFTNDIMNVSETLDADENAGVDKDMGMDKYIEINCTESNVDSFEVTQDTANLDNYTIDENSCK
ncbi:4051_t:CDS:2, partial [Gigaspora rosea]